MMQLKRPMLAGKFDAEKQKYPVLGSAKLDGFRALAVDGCATSRAMKPLPNRHIQAFFATYADLLHGLDGEIVVGEPNDPEVFNRTQSGVNSRDGEPDFRYYIFDRWDSSLPYDERIISIQHRNFPAEVRWLEQEEIFDLDQLNAFEQRIVDLNYEGIILRDPKGLYKQGRATTKGGELLKLKRWEDAEARIIDFVEEMHNGNEAIINELGLTKRSSAKGNKTGKGTLGAYVVEGINTFDGVQFEIGSGFTAAQRAEFWDHREEKRGRIVSYKYFAPGVKDKPRHPIYKGERALIDLS